MTLPSEVRREVEARLGAVKGTAGVGGGCISPAVRLELADRPVFLKYNLRAPAGLFAGEAEGLERLRAATTALRIPAVLAVREVEGAAERGLAWLALEWLEPAAPAAGFPDQLGRGLAELHRVRGEGWGWHRDGFIGSLPQQNSPVASATWSDFWIERRLEPQLRRARRRGRAPGTPEQWDRLFAMLPDLLAPAEGEGPSLLHGDLWSGNVLAPGGAPALVDPAAYFGHREVDLAMAELFGGFAPSFFAAYQESWPLLPETPEVRRGVYQLYYLLVHVNLFDGAYGRQTERLLDRVLHAG